MSKIADHAQGFLDEVGYSLGYNINNLPHIRDIETVWAHRVHIWEYKGMTEDEYYWSGK